MGTTVIQIWVVMTAITWILGIIQIYGYYLFKSMQKLLIVQKRYPKLVIAESIMVILLLFIVFPLWMNTVFGILFVDNKFLFHLGWILLPPGMHFICNVEACRLWLISYDLHYAHSSKHNEWKSQIDNSSEQENWYLHNRNKWGNKRYVIYRVLIYYIFAATVPLILFYSVFGFEQLFYGQMIDGMFYAVPISIVLYTFYKCPKTKDNFLFHYEFKVTTIIWISCLILYFINQIIAYLGYATVNYTFCVVTGITTVAVPSLLSTIWIPRQISHLDAWKDKLLPKRFKDLIVMKEIIHSNGHLSAAKNGSGQDTLDTKLKNVLKNEKTFETFIKWMYCEFSSESILCFVELCQFKEKLIDFVKNDTDDIAMNYSYINLLYDNIPKSSIVYGQLNESNNQNITEIETFKHVAHLLYQCFAALR
eukprot:394655_1